MGQAAQATASALLRGARGNSGVILSLLFRGFAKAIKDRETMDGRDLAIALDFGVAAAYKAVMKPAEGTILTVSRMAAARAAGTAREDNCAEAVLAAAIEEGQAALADTVNQNPVLKKAGVVDAGGKGFLIILQGMLDQLQGKPMPELSEEEPEEEKADFGALSAEEITFAFDTVFIVRKPSPHVNLEPFRTYLNGIGDSLVIGEDDEAFKVHVHTNIPGAALTEAQKYGTLELAKIENMRTQAEDLAAGRHVQSTDDLEAGGGGAGEPGLRPGRAGEGRPGEGVRLCGRVRRRGPGGRVPGPGGGRDDLRGTDHEPLHRGHSTGDRPHPRPRGLCAPQQQEHHHGGRAVRPRCARTRPWWSCPPRRCPRASPPCWRWTRTPGGRSSPRS